MREPFLEENVHALCCVLPYLCTVIQNVMKMEMQKDKTQRQQIARRMASEYLAFLIDMERLKSINQSK